MRISRSAALFLLASQAACARPGSEGRTLEAAVATDSARLAVPGGEIWYRVVGEGDGTPVILLHGGPGMASYYLRSLEALGDERTVVRYDQLGGGKSDVVSDTALFTIAHFVAELDALRAHLGLERVHLYGHSWGTMLAVEYYQAHPQHVASMVLASPALEAAAWERNVRELLKTLPDSMQRAVTVREAEQNYTAPDYQAAVGEFYNRFVYLRPIAADLDSMFERMNAPLYQYMWGPSEFTATGTLKTYDATSKLKEVAVPVLFTVGEFDEAGPDVVRRHAALTPGAHVVVIPDAAHITQWDNPEVNLEAVRTFLREVDGRR
jgi:proline iminopeptidase